MVNVIFWKQFIRKETWFPKLTSNIIFLLLFAYLFFITCFPSWCLIQQSTNIFFVRNKVYLFHSNSTFSGRICFQTINLNWYSVYSLLRIADVNIFFILLYLFRVYFLYFIVFVLSSLFMRRRVNDSPQIYFKLICKN